MRSKFKSLISGAAILLLLVLCLHHVQGQARDQAQKVAFKGLTSSMTLSTGPVSIPMETITGRLEADNGYAWKYGYDVTIEQGRLIVKVAVNLIPAGGTTQPELNRVKPLWEEGIERIWSDSFSLETTSGLRYPMFVDISFRGPHFHHDVIVRPGKGRTDELNWNILDSPELVAHEFGHMIGMYDEYEKGALAPENAVIDPDSIMASNPGEGAATHARHYEPFRKWFIDKTMISNVRTVHEKTNHK